MREPHEVNPPPQTPEEILRHGISEIARLAPGSHLEDPCYSARRAIKEYAKRILDAAEASRGSNQTRTGRAWDGAKTWTPRGEVND